VVVDRVGHIRVHELSKVLEDDQLVHYTSQRLLRISEHVIEEREQIIWIIDLNGKIMQLASKKILDCLQKIIATVQKYFPELLYRYPNPNVDSSSSILPCSSIPFGQKLHPISPRKPSKRL
jgi:hypothetical protein